MCSSAVREGSLDVDISDASIEPSRTGDEDSEVAHQLPPEDWGLGTA